jgi:uncharacterized protein YbjT (DUF2867 family)
MMSRCPVIAVVGATGAQGGGLARAILADPARSFAVRAITRCADAGAARTLAALGAQVVAADLDDAASLERALQGAYGVFGGLEQARHVAQAARRAAVRHVIWSKLEDVRKDGSQSDTFGAADARFRDLPTTVLRCSSLWDNLIPLGMGLRRAADGGLDFVLPMGTRRRPGIAAADIGPCALGIFQRCGQFIGHTVGIAGEHLDGTQMATALSGAIGEPVRYVPRSFADRLRYWHAGNDEYCAERAVALARELYPGLQSFEQWLGGQAQPIPVPAVGACAPARAAARPR